MILTDLSYLVNSDKYALDVNFRERTSIISLLYLVRQYLLIFVFLPVTALSYDKSLRQHDMYAMLHKQNLSEEFKYSSKKN